MTYREMLRGLREPTEALREATPTVWGAFGALHQAATADGEVPRRIKEAAALAISVVKHCDGCIGYHARAAARAGATPGEVAELLGVALLMDGGSASVFAPLAWTAYHEFASHGTAGPAPSP